MKNGIVLACLWPLVRAEYALRRIGLVRDRLSWADKKAMEHGSLLSDWFYR
jgi:hypothetical protein